MRVAACVAGEDCRQALRKNLPVVECRQRVGQGEHGVWEQVAGELPARAGFLFWPAE
jgi:hypothetical protein